MNLTDEMDVTPFNMTVYVIAPLAYFNETISNVTVPLYQESKIDIPKYYDNYNFSVRV